VQANYTQYKFGIFFYQIILFLFYKNIHRAIWFSSNGFKFIKMTDNSPSEETASVCFFSLHAYSLLTKSPGEIIGGAELQQVVIGKLLVQEGFRVTFIVLDHKQENQESIRGITLLKTLPNDYVIKGPFSFIYALLVIIRAFVRTDAKTFYVRGAGRDAGIAAIYCFFARKRFVFALSSDMDIDGTFYREARFYERVLQKCALVIAQTIVAQTEYQKNLLDSTLWKKTVIIRNVLISDTAEDKKETLPVILWVGKVRPRWKQPEIFLEIARRIPEAKFQMIGGTSKDLAFYEQIEHEANQITNLEFTGFVPFDKIGSYFAKASILVNTSSNEGFPNTFLQAWSHGIPVVSLNVDPDEIICRYRLGYHSGSIEQMVSDIRTLLSNSELRNEMGMNGKRYINEFHSVDSILQEYFHLFLGDQRISKGN